MNIIGNSRIRVNMLNIISLTCFEQEIIKIEVKKKLSRWNVQIKQILTM